MNQRSRSAIALVLLAIVFFVFTAFNNALLSGLKLDLTENGLYTLSAGSRQIAADIDEPVNLYFFFSEQASTDLTGLRSYADRVWQLLEQYEAAAGGKINLQRIDPEPFTDAEDQAAAFGLQAVPVGTGNDLYFGLAGTGALDDEVVIEFFQPDRESFLEYEISQLINRLANSDRPVVGVMSSIQVMEEMDTQTFQSRPSWVVIDQLRELYEVREVDPTVSQVADDIDLLLIIHPKDLAEETLFAIDQFAMTGGRILAFVDPLAEVDQQGGGPMMQPAPPRPSDLNRLTEAWGVRLVPDQILGDAQLALQVAGPDGQPVRHLGIMGLGPDELADDDVVTAPLELLNVASAGFFEAAGDASLDALATTSAYAAPLPVARAQFMADPGDLQRGFEPTGERYPLAVRLSGAASSAFPDGFGDVGDPVGSTDELNVVLVADVDLLTDRLWVQVQNFFGQRIASPFANNGDLLVNAVDNLIGSPALISVRSRGRFTRPFEVVQNLRREAEARYLASADDLQAELAETERKLAELEAERTENNLLSLSPEQEAAIDQFQQEKVRIRSELRDVRYQLDKDIEALGATLKLLNVILLPLVLTLLLFLMTWFARREGERA